MTQPTLIQDAHTELHHRTRGRTDRLARLAAAGAPTDHGALRRWVGALQDAAHEAANGVFLACVVRQANGFDADLPTSGPYGCRIDRIPIQATIVAAGDVIDEDEDGNEVRAETGFYTVRYAECGPGYMGPRHLSMDDCGSPAEAEDQCRAALLARGDCYRTRAEAEAALPAMLAARDKSTTTL